MEKIVLLPPPQSVSIEDGHSSVKVHGLAAALPKAFAGLAAPLQTLWPELRLKAAPAEISFEEDDTLAREAYCMTVGCKNVRIRCSGQAGALYGLMTLRQLAMQAQDTLPLCTITDAPALPIRGYMLDISRGKVPTLKTLKAMADQLARLKYNHLELYIEGFSFAYPSFPEVWQELTPITPKEIQELDAYCRERCIDLVPQQNSLGHMAPWLARPEYAPLAEGGLTFRGQQLPPTTLDASDPGSIALVEKLTADLLPNFTSSYFHVGLDEPFELGKGKNKSRADREGTGKLYLQYVEKLRDMAHRYGKTMMMWGDVIGSSAELAGELPKDIVVVDWGYEAEHPAQLRARELQKAGLRFCMCAGTSTWLSFTGMTDNMLANISAMAQAAHTCGAEGLILSEWGDMGHFQYLSSNWPGICYAAAWAWNVRGTDEQTCVDALNRMIFGDEAAIMGQICMDAGRYYLLEEFRMPCRALATTPLQTGITDPDTYEDHLKMIVKLTRFFSEDSVCWVYEESFANRRAFQKEPLLAMLRQLRERLQLARPKTPEGVQAQKEYQNALLSIEILCRIRAVIMGDRTEEAGLGQMLADMSAEHRSLWLCRNKSAGLEKSLAPFQRLAEQVSPNS